MDPLGLCPAKNPYVYYAGVGVGGFASIAELIAWVTAPAFDFIAGIVSGISVAVVAVEAAVVATIVLVFSTNTQMDEEFLEQIQNEDTSNNENDEANDDTKGGTQDKKLGKKDLNNLDKKVRKDGYDSIEDLKSPGGKGAGKLDLYTKPNGDIVIKPKGGKGPGEPTGYNIYDL